MLAILFLTSCGMTDMQPDQEIGEDILTLRGRAPKINVCKYDAEIEDWVVINVNVNAWPAFEAQGAVQLIDEDGDGYVTMENGCGIPVDCDDAYPDLTDNCPPSVTNPETGKTWMDRNLGAAQVAESITDSKAYGDLYQWGRAADGHQIIHRFDGDGKTTSGTTSNLSSTNQPIHGDFITTTLPLNDWRSPQNDNLWQDVYGVNNPCPSGYRLPTMAEWNAEIATWDSSDPEGAFASHLKLPLAGYREFIDGRVIRVGNTGRYASSTVSGTILSHLALFGSSAGEGTQYRSMGYSVRCIKD